MCSVYHSTSDHFKGRIPTATEVRARRSKIKITVVIVATAMAKIAGDNA
jgi:hypothetical protein